MAPAGTLAFFAYLQVHTGDWLAYVHATSRGWGQGFDFGLSTFRTLQQVVADRQFGLYIVMLAVVAAMYLLVRWPLSAPPGRLASGW